MVERFHKDYKNGMDSSFSLRFGDLSWTTNPQSANQLAELGKRLNEGVQNVEVGALNQQVFDSIPQQHFEEMRRLSKLGGVELSMHAPLTDPAGFSQQGWQEHQRNLAEQEFKDVIDRAVDLDPKGGMPVNFHSSGGGIPAVIWEKKEEGVPEAKQMITAVNTQTGEIKALAREKMDWLNTDDKELTPERRLKSLNQTSWDQEILNFMSLKKQKEEVERLKQEWRIKYPEGREFYRLEKAKQQGRLLEEEVPKWEALRMQDESYNKHKSEIDQNMMSQLNSLYNDYVSCWPEDKKKDREHQMRLKQFGEIKKRFKGAAELGEEFDKSWNKWMNKNGKRDPTIVNEEREKRRNELNDKLIKKGLNISPEQVGNVLMELKAPERYRPVDDVAKEKAAETFSNVAFHAYKKHGKKAPLVAIENVYPEWTLSRADSLKGLVESAKKKLSEKLRSDKKLKLSEREANAIAEKNLGVTWDVGHINQLRKYGYSKKDIIEESKKIAKHVKHLHLTDNFGYSDSHLSPGMGNVPIKEQVEEIAKAGFKGKAVIEGGGMFQQFQTNPIPYAVEGLDSPFYSYDQGPSWTDVRDLYSSYMFGFGDILPDQHFKSQGAGFSMLPKELGGQGAGDKGRFANQ
jgi:sugar phosphate isomerase/epimerase